MLYFLFSIFQVNIFQYITFRAGLSFFLAFFLSVLFMPLFIRWAKAKKANQPISTYVPTHEGKKDTPTMGGIVFVLSTLISSLLCINLYNLYALFGLLTLFLFCFVGARDDFMKIAAKNNSGMSARMKFLLLALFALTISYALYSFGHQGKFYLPFVKDPLFDMGGVFSILFWTLVFLATSNAVNITDGLDGLATVPSICALISLSIFVYIGGHAAFSQYLLWPQVSQSGELVVVSLALIGSLFGFLWYNCHPAQVFMGDSGSLALGSFIAYMAIVSNNEVLLFLIGFVFVWETISVILQIGSYKIRKKKVFLMAPIHHHYEMKGWAENKIIIRFWIIAILSNLVALLSLKIR
ncbi:phospho-N-acetylmuramoyl-pentapeptide-transferase [Helicobacter kayseriensis]|uniref:phospho-N-acetylmuramoyl-pentapeptide- transferase n=1 Tax=Helicobacter kayseriensis TaxID=2905877 RepID=UPI001E617C97|nr:phospho-N-acetylmuramoyl-pentapeptide-transferase [Helicobacter kayseriensis]MCE3047281.1 phospho-N-acetylmuramoyl-pentapeptide-transferase [Helicobacter kayseriensis]MCE3048652.1 phospho-N-acetylmuramoyl-pentapeptide-transferase [Helicobacter kayseriensis]